MAWSLSLLYECTKGRGEIIWNCLKKEVSAVHALDGKSYKRHKDTLANFNKDYVKTEIFPRDFGRKIAQAEEQIMTAKELIEQIEANCLNRLKR